MLVALLRRAALPLVLALSLAPLAVAGVSADDTMDRVEDEASDLHPWAAWAVDRVGGDEDDGEEAPGDGQDEESGSGESSSGSQGTGSENPLSTGRPVVVVVLRTVDGVLDGVDPLGIVGEQVNPVREAAEGLPLILLPPAEPTVSEPAPATASADLVRPDASVPLLVAGTAVAAAAVAALWMAGSSGSVGAAGAAGTGGKLAGTDLRRLLPFASPLFTRFEKDTVLGHPKREALYALILQDPGISLQALCDNTGLSRTAVTHHLRLMELQHLIVSKRMGRSRHYYENGGRFGRDQKDAYAVLQNDRSKAVADFVRKNPGAIQKAICAALGVQASVAHWHLRRLQEAQLVEAIRHGRTVSYFPGAGLKAMPVLPAAVTAPAVPAAPLPLTA